MARAVRCRVARSSVDGAGDGVFAVDAAPAGAVVTRFAGSVRPKEEYDRIAMSGAAAAEYVLSIGGGRVLVPPPGGEWSDGAMGHKVNDSRCVVARLPPRHLRSG
eukprot:gene7774-5704_t